MKIISVMILALVQITVIPVVAALSAKQASPPAVVRLVGTENMTTIYKSPDTSTYKLNATVSDPASVGAASALEI